MHDEEEEKTLNKNEQKISKITESNVLPDDDGFKEVEKLVNNFILEYLEYEKPKEMNIISKLVDGRRRVTCRCK